MKTQPPSGKPDETPKDPATKEWRSHSPLLRKKAESVASQIPEGETLSKERSKELVHELYVHQIELEIQNEELRRIQHELGASQAKYFDLFELAPVSYLTIARDSRILEANLTLSSLLGIPRSQITGKPLTRFILPDDQDVFYRQQQEIFGGGTTAPGELRLRAGDGSTVWVRMEARLVSEADGGSECRLTLSDISGLRRTEEELVNLRTAVEQSANTILITDAEGAIVYMNPASEKSSGYAAAEAAGQTPRILRSGEQDDTFYSLLWKTIKSGRTWRGEFHNRRKDGALYWEEATISPVVGGDGKISHFIAVKVDVTDRKRMEAVLRESIDRAEEAALAKSEFLANMSHEIRTPLNAILGMAELLEMDPEGPDAKEYMQTIRSSGHALLSIIGDILDFSKIEAGRLQIESAPMSLAECARSAVDIVAPLAAKKSLPLVLAVAPDLPAAIIGDITRLRQIIVNLLSNAVKFSDRGEVALTLSRGHPAPDGERLHVSVRDHGMGISPKDSERLFQSFTQVDASTTRRFGGSGLGLAICRSLVELMHGRIWVESKPDEGSEFQFEIPLVPAENAAPVTQEPPRKIPEVELLAARCPLRILVAEDNLVSQRLIGLMLKHLGYRPDFADNGVEVLSSLKQKPCDLILMDVQMPMLDGLETTAEILRRYPDARRPQIIALTANALTGDREACLAAGMDGYISKPVSIQHLAEAIEQAAAKR